MNKSNILLSIMFLTCVNAYGVKGMDQDQPTGPSNEQNKELEKLLAQEQVQKQLTADIAAAYLLKNALKNVKQQADDLKTRFDSDLDRVKSDMALSTMSPLDLKKALMSNLKDVVLRLDGCLGDCSEFLKRTGECLKFDEESKEIIAALKALSIQQS